jgi:DNA modification methylase
MITKKRLIQKKMSAIISTIVEVPLDTAQIDQESLDLANRTRTNLFPWRGQFSPELVELLLTRYAKNGDVVLDPYAGVGTAIIEAARLKLSGIGVEINPAALAMAETCLFISQPITKRKEVFKTIQIKLDEIYSESLPLFGKHNAGQGIVESLVDLIRKHNEEFSIKNILTNTLLRLLEFPQPYTAELVFKAFKQHEYIAMNLPYCKNSYRICHADARALPLKNNEVDLVVTSPPYINVFNYHQNNRKAMEMVGWDILNVAYSEIGSNRKHRSNRFLTVIQYCLDMAIAICELKRVLKPGGRIIIVVGRESNVRQVAFPNGAILVSIADSCGFSIPFRQERKFVSRFGTTVFEDILHLIPISHENDVQLDDIRRIAKNYLNSTLNTVEDDELLRDIADAISRVQTIEPSPIFNPLQAFTSR